MTGSSRDLSERLARYLEQRIRPASSEVVTCAIQVRARTLGGEPVPFAEALSGDFLPIAEGDQWGTPWSTTWLEIAFDPEAAAEADELVVDLGFTAAQAGFQAEGLAYGPGGDVVKAVNPRSRWIPLDSADIRSSGRVYVEAAANPTILSEATNDAFRPTQLGARPVPGAKSDPLYRLGRIEIVRRQREVEYLEHDLTVLAGLAAELPETSARRGAVEHAIADALAVLDLDAIVSSAPRARAALALALAQRAAASAHRVSAVGHAHIDSAWLWPFRETRRKVARTVANVLQLMDEDPDLVYAMSSAQQYEWLKQDHPALFSRVADQVANGRFVPVGGMWVESDTNMPGGESLVRQFLEGWSFFRDEFGIEEISVVWLPDSLGLYGALPQLIRLVGAHRFVTQKLSWNDTNVLPHHTFGWEGIDGSRVLTHLPPVDTYNARLTGAELAHAERVDTDKAILNRSLVPFGYGDGGGGPTREMLGRARRLVDTEGSARVAIESPDAFFEAVEATGATLGEWWGELYLEYHRGVFTSRHRIKEGNRRGEALFREAELWSTQAAVRVGSAYPHDELRALWRRFLLLQFHDVLPGSSIAWVNEDAGREHAEIARALETMTARALAALAAGAEAPLTANPSPHPRLGVPPHTIGAAAESGSAATIGLRDDGALVLDNGRIRAVVDATGEVVFLAGADGRDVVTPGLSLNRLELFTDAPARWDAWDIDRSFRDSPKEWPDVGPLRWGVTESGTAWVEVTRRTGASSAVQVTRLIPGVDHLEFETTVAWHERDTLLKAAFSLDIAAAQWSAETQFGHVSRSAVANTSWDEAKFEACAHRFVHIGEPGFGVAVANESTYGHEVRHVAADDGRGGSLLRLSLLRSPQFPDPDGDVGDYVLRYAVAPGATMADAVRLGYQLNDRLRSVAGVPVGALAVSSAPGVLIDTVKEAHDRSGDVIVRLYESLGERATTAVTLGFVRAAVVETDLLERPTGEPVPADEPVRLEFRPFEIKTLRISRPRD